MKRTGRCRVMGAQAAPGYEEADLPFTTARYPNTPPARRFEVMRRSGEFQHSAGSPNKARSRPVGMCHSEHRAKYAASSAETVKAGKTGSCGQLLLAVIRCPSRVDRWRSDVVRGFCPILVQREIVRNGRCATHFVSKVTTRQMLGQGGSGNGPHYRHALQKQQTVNRCAPPAGALRTPRFPRL